MASLRFLFVVSVCVFTQLLLFYLVSHQLPLTNTFDFYKAELLNNEPFPLQTPVYIPPRKVPTKEKSPTDLSSIPEGHRTKLAQITGAPFPLQHNLSIDKLPKRTMTMCRNCLWHTLKTTTTILNDGGTFVHTGDIDDLWLRDSAAQVHPYLVWARHDLGMRRLVSGLIQRHAFYILFDPYANAFRIDTSYKFNQWQMDAGRHDYISTWNYELDSGAYYMRLIYSYWRVVPNDPIFQNPIVRKAANRMLDVWEAEQRHEEDIPTVDYFNPAKKTSLYRYPGLARNGKGTETSYTGMTWTGFRPSDDECVYGYLVPANMFASATLRRLSIMADTLWMDEDLKSRATVLADQIDQGIQHAIVEHPKYGKIYAFEVDGLGHSLLMDDANVPSLISIPYLGWNYDKQIYQNTRRFVLSKDNPTFAESRDKSIRGYGSPHMNDRIFPNIWPMGQIMLGLTAETLEEKLDWLSQVSRTDGNTGWMHESYSPDNPNRFTRSWFCWADALFAELVMSTVDPQQDKECAGSERPQLAGI